ncbi:hypothetical protein, partial [Brachybacterium fresconis]|uniref:hypothetical protein n=1 Tax=Brachybacterium fresconis TaxID=173363 RepID=UPI0031DC53E3
MGAELETTSPYIPAISPEDVQSVGNLLTSSRSAETRRSYASAIRTFTTWCRERGYRSFPASPEVIGLFPVRGDGERRVVGVERLVVL